MHSLFYVFFVFFGFFFVFVVAAVVVVVVFFSVAPAKGLSTAASFWCY